MCGIAGFWAPEFRSEEAEDILREMITAIAHRGPDDSGTWTDAARGIALGHRRLSILDLTLRGHQPMVSRDGRYVIVFNGEIYNFVEVRERLTAAGDVVRGRSDTEVMLAAISRWGLQIAVGTFAGMFAFALWDREKNTLHLVRDRVGEKPLYYGWMGDTLLFGSELKAMRAHPAWRAVIDRNALTLVLRHSYIPAPHSIYQGVRKVEPATIVSVREGGATATARYWRLEEVIRAGLADPLDGPDSETLAEVERGLRRTIAQEMVADVPLGAFLSGGIDSSAVVALMQQESPRPVRTFTVGFHDDAYNEATFARAVAHHLGTDHTEVYVTPDEARAVIPRLPALYDEPFADPSQIPTFLVAQLARQHVTVALSGDGGDELFGGYNRYQLGQRMWGCLAPVFPWLRELTAAGITKISPTSWDRLLGGAQKMLPKRVHVANLGDRMHKLAKVVPASSDADFYHRLVSHWPRPDDVVLGGQEATTLLAAEQSPPPETGFVEWMMYEDTRTYLPDDIMVKVDRATMGVSLESRAPFLDHRLIELGWRVPFRLKMREGKGKWTLRQILFRYVPSSLVERPKMGFAVPIDSWLRGPLREWAGDLLAHDRVRRDGYFVPDEIATKWREHLSGQRNWQYLLWDVLMFQAWLEAQ